MQGIQANSRSCEKGKELFTALMQRLEKGKADPYISFPPAHIPNMQGLPHARMCALLFSLLLI